MPPPYVSPHFSIFSNIPHVRQNTVGFIPSLWVSNFKLQKVPDVAALPAVQLDRQAVRAICQSPAHSVLFGYVCVMAWGWQGKDSKTKKHVTQSWNQSDLIRPILEKLRFGGLTRENAYDMFCGQNRIKGLGPSYFTKLLYFFSPSSDFYIMDKWTGKSINLLTGEEVVLMNGSPTSHNKGLNYQSFCQEIDHLGWLVGNTGEQIEERLFFTGGKSPKMWLAHVKKNDV
jgi:hypothetical protein